MPGARRRWARFRRMGVGVLSLAALGCRSPAPAVLEFWAMGREGEVVQQLVPEFERRAPEVRVRVQQIPWSAAHEKLLTAYVGDAMPDLFQVGNTWIPEFVALGAIEPLDGCLAASAGGVADYFPGILDTNRLGGVTYAVPWYVDTRLLFYRTDILAQAGYTQPPRTWEAWLDAMGRVKALVGPANYAILLPFSEWQPPVILALQLGAELLRDNDQYGNFRSAPVRRALALYLDLFERQLAPRAGDAQVANVYHDFASGFFSFYITGPWNIGEFSRRLPASVAGRWATAPLPAPDADWPGASLAGGASVAIFRGSARKDMAWRFAEYLTEPAQQLAFYRLTGDLPSRMSAWQDPSLADNRYAQAFWAQLQRLRSTPKIPEWERIASTVVRYTEAAVRGRLTLDEALAALDRDVDAILEKRRWLLQRGRLPERRHAGS